MVVIKYHDVRKKKMVFRRAKYRDGYIIDQ